MGDVSGSNEHNESIIPLHYYQFNIGDYSSHTSRLPPIQDLAYRRILDIYYLLERPLSGCSTDVAQEIGLLEFEVDVAFVLGKYFKEIDGKWVNGRCEKEIKLYQSKLKSASRAGKASAKARQLAASERTFNEDSTDVQPNNKHKPLNKKQEPVKKKRVVFTPPSLQEVEIYCRERKNTIDAASFIDHYQTNGWMRGKSKIKDWKACVRTWEKSSGQSRQISGKQSSSARADAAVRQELAKIDAGHLESVAGDEVGSH